MSESNDLDKHSLEELTNELKFRSLKNNSEKKGVLGKKSSLANADPLAIYEAQQKKQQVIYGTDDRRDFHEITDTDVLENVKSVVALFEANQVKDMGDGTSEISVQKFGDAYELCVGEKFREQPVGAFCSGFLVAPDIICTAGHCATDIQHVKDTRFVFGFRMNSPGQATTKINNSDIYSGKSLIGREQVDDGADWALVKLDRPVANARIVKIRKEGKIDDNSGVYVIGHPCGLPLKQAGNAVVRSNSKETHMVCNLDTYGGNSGSAVFNNKTHEAEGILVRGEKDFVPVGNCNRSNVCPTTGCRGEDVTRTTQFAHLLDT